MEMRTLTNVLSPTEAILIPKKEYDEFQQAAIEAPTPALIVAGPGSGKTSTLIGRVEYLIDTQGVAPEHILALTFSRKAAEEMQERLHAVMAAQAIYSHGQYFSCFLRRTIAYLWEPCGFAPGFRVPG